MQAPDESLRIAPNAPAENQHVCAFFNSIDEQHRVLRAFIKDGFNRGDKAFHLIDPERREDREEAAARDLQRLCQLTQPHQERLARSQ
jgi:hypothetical protein